MLNEKNAQRNKYIFLGICVLTSLVLLFDRIFKLGVWHTGILFGRWDPRYTDSFMDFFWTLDFAGSGNPYYFVNMGAIYPPICYVIFSYLYRLFPRSLVDPFPHGESATMLRDLQIGRMLILLLGILAILAIAYIIFKKIKMRDWEKALLLLCILFSAPLLNVLERANIMLYALPLLCFYVAEYDSDRAILRELAILSLAVAAAIKLYPAILGILLLRDRKYKLAIRCAIYAILLTILPCFYCYRILKESRRVLQPDLYGLQMSVRNRYEVTAAIHSISRTDAATVLIYAMTANILDEDARQVMDAGINGHVVRPKRPFRHSICPHDRQKALAAWT